MTPVDEFFRDRAERIEVSPRRTLWPLIGASVLGWVALGAAVIVIWRLMW